MMIAEFGLAAAQLRAIADAIESADEGDGAQRINPRTNDAGYVMSLRRLRKDEGFTLTVHGWNRAAASDLTLRVQTN